MVTPALVRVLPLLFAFFFAAPALCQQVWIKSFTGMQPGEKPHGYKYDRNVYPQDVQVTFQYDTLGTIEFQISVNFGPFNQAFSCNFDDASGQPGTCFFTLPYDCGKVTVRVRQLKLFTTVTSNPVDIFPFNNTICLPQCDSCQLSANGQATGRPINVVTGKLWYKTTDLALSGPYGLRFSRWYDNQSGFSGDLGFGWRHNYSGQLDLSQAANFLVVHRDEEDVRTYFTGLGPGFTVHDDISGSDLALNLAGTVYTLTTWEGEKYLFDSAGRLTQVQDRIGNTHTIARDTGQGSRITTVTDVLGRTLTFGYGAANRITSISSNMPGLASPALTMAYGPLTNCATGELCSVTGPDGKIWKYEYDGSHQLTKVLDPLNHASEVNAYTGNRCTLQSTEGGQNSLSLLYGSGTTTVTDGLARATTYTWDPKLLLVTSISGGPGCACGGGQSRSFTWDQFRRKRTETDGLGATHTITWAYGRDAVANYPDGFVDTVTAYPSPTSRTDPLSSGLNRVTSWTYYLLSDARRDLVQTETVPSADTGGQSKITTLTYNTQGVLTSRQEQGRVGGTLTTLTTTFGPDAKGRILSINGPRTDLSDVTTYAYYPDNDSDLARRGQLSTITDAVGNVTTHATGSTPFNTYNPYGQPRRTTDPNGVVREMTYDQRGRLTISTLKGVTPDPDLTTTNLYDDAGRLTKVTFPLGNATSYIYDGSDRLTDTVRVDATGNQRERLHLTYNVMSQKTQEDAQLCTTPAANCSTWATPRRTQSFTYDAFGRLKDIVHPVPANAKIIHTYDAAGNLFQVQDENHATPNTTYAYDFANRLISVNQVLTGVTGGITTSYGYDVQDNLNKVTDPNGNVTDYLYDDFGRLRRQTSPASGTTDHTHDGAGNVLTSDDANDAVTTRTYDAINRIKSTASTRSGRPTERVSWVYDDLSPGKFARGRLASISDPSGVTKYAYERRGLLREEVKAILDNNYVTRYGYDANGNATSMRYPSGRTLAYAYDFADRQATVAATLPAPQNYVTSTAYEPFGPLKTLTFANGTERAVTLDQRYRVELFKLTLLPSTLRAQQDFTLDAVGNITAITDGTDTNFNRAYAYDDLNRLTTANSGSSLWGTNANNKYTYDKMGNVLSLRLGAGRIVNPFTYEGTTTPRLDAVTENGTFRDVVLDPAGNETQVGSGNTFLYSARNLLAQGEGFGYVYDGASTRVLAREAVLGASVLVPSSRPAGGEFVLTVFGSGFLNNDKVVWNNVERNATFNSANQLTATITAGEAGATGTAPKVLVRRPGMPAIDSNFARFLIDFGDVPAANLLYPFVKSIAIRNITAGCGGGNYCLNDPVTREQMAVFLLRADEGEGYPPPACTVPTFADVPCTSPFAIWIEELVRRGVTAGCDTNPPRYCPTNPVTRAQMAVFLLLTYEGSGYVPPAATGLFADVPVNDPFAKWIEELARRGISGGCGGGNYCPNDPVTRGQMAVFLTVTWGLTDNVTPAGNRRHFIYDASRHLIAESGYATAYTSPTAYEYIWFDDLPVAQVDAIETLWTFTDHLGTPLVQTNSAGTILWRVEYEPYGKVWARRPTGLADRHQPLRLPGQEAEQLPNLGNNGATERFYNQLRWYRFGWGRYTQPDPIGLLGGTNPFKYGNDNPVSWIDPTGLAPCQKNASLVGCEGRDSGCCVAKCIDDLRFSLCLRREWQPGLTLVGTIAGAGTFGVMGGLVGGVRGACIGAVAGGLAGYWGTYYGYEWVITSAGQAASFKGCLARNCGVECEEPCLGDRLFSQIMAEQPQR